MPDVPSSQKSRSVASKIFERKGTSRNRGVSRMESSTPHPLKNLFEEWKKFSSGIKQVRESMKKCSKNGRKVDKSYLLLPYREYKL